MNIKIFADGANLTSMIELNDNNPLIKGFTTNPTLLRNAGVTDYEAFAKEALNHITVLPISFEVFSDTWIEMEREARKIASWGNNVYVKIPPMTTQEVGTRGLIRSLVKDGIKINATCIFTYEQIDNIIELLGNTESIISIFAGRIMDSDVDARGFIQYAKYNKFPKQEILWASTRELWNIKMAEEAGADIITLGHDLIAKMSLIGKDLNELCLDTVKQFRQDAVNSGYKI